MSTVLNSIYSMTDRLLRKERKAVDRSVDALLAELKHENTLLAESPLRLLQQVLKIYRGARPVLATFAKLPLVPPTWGAVVESLMRALDALAEPEVIGEIANRFKAGRDLAA